MKLSLSLLSKEYFIKLGFTVARKLLPCLADASKWRGTGGWEPGGIRARGGREARGDKAGCESHVRARGGRRMRGIKFVKDFLVPF